MSKSSGSRSQERHRTYPRPENGAARLRSRNSSRLSRRRLTFSRFEPRQFIAQDDKVITLGHYTAKTSTGGSFDSDFVMVFTLRNGKVTEFQEFLDSAGLNAAFAPASVLAVAGGFNGDHRIAAIRSRFCAVGQDDRMVGLGQIRHREENAMKKVVGAAGMAAVALLAMVATTQRPSASSHREALAILNEPCADNTDTYAWVSDGSHDKLYLIMNFNPLHEPGQGNQGLRACNGYRYEFHIGKGASLEDRRGLPRRVHEQAQARSAAESRRIRWAAATSCSGSSPAAPRP